MAAVWAETKRVLSYEDTKGPVLFKGGTRSLSDSEILGLLANEIGHLKFEHVTAAVLGRKLGLRTCLPVLVFALLALSPLGAAMGSAPGQ